MGTLYAEYVNLYTKSTPQVALQVTPQVECCCLQSPIRLWVLTGSLEQEAFVNDRPIMRVIRALHTGRAHTAICAVVSPIMPRPRMTTWTPPLIGLCATSHLWALLVRNQRLYRWYRLCKEYLFICGGRFILSPKRYTLIFSCRLLQNPLFFQCRFTDVERLGIF